MSFRRKPTLSELDKRLRKLVNWESVAIHLPNVDQTDIDKVNKNKTHSEVDHKKLAIFNVWLKKCHYASWNHVTLALEIAEENTIAAQIQKRLLEEVTSLSKPQVQVLIDAIKDDESWDNFALNLPGINQHIINEAKESVNEVKYKELLLKKWLDEIKPDATWVDVVCALVDAQMMKQACRVAKDQPKNQDEAAECSSGHNGEIEINSAVVDKLSDFEKSFKNLSFSAVKELKSRAQQTEFTVNDLALFVLQDDVYKNSSELKKNMTIEEFLIVLANYYNFLNCGLLVNLAEKFLNPSNIFNKLKAHEQKVNEFSESETIGSLYGSLQLFVKIAAHEVPVTLCIQSKLTKRKLSLINTFIEWLFPKELTNGFKWYRVMPGSLIIVFLVPHHISCLLVNHSKRKMQFMRILRMSLQIGDVCIVRHDLDSNFSYNTALLIAAQCNNLEAIKFLIQHFNVSVNVRSSKKLTKKLNSARLNQSFTMPKHPYHAGSTPLVIAVCNGEQNIVQFLLDSGANPNIETECGNGALWYAKDRGIQISLRIAKWSSRQGHGYFSYRYFDTIPSSCMPEPMEIDYQYVPKTINYDMPALGKRRLDQIRTGPRKRAHCDDFIYDAASSPRFNNEKPPKILEFEQNQFQSCMAQGSFSRSSTPREFKWTEYNSGSLISLGWFLFCIWLLCSLVILICALVIFSFIT